MEDEFILRITLGNELMRSGYDVAAALRSVAAKLQDAGELDAVYTSTITDGNGITVGEYHVITPGGTPGEADSAPRRSADGRINDAMDLVDDALRALDRYDSDALAAPLMAEVRERLALAYDKLQNALQARKRSA